MSLRRSEDENARPGVRAWTRTISVVRPETGTVYFYIERVGRHLQRLRYGGTGCLQAPIDDETEE